MGWVCACCYIGAISLSFRNEIMLLGEKIKSNFKTAVDEEFYDKIYAIASYIF